MDFPYNKCWLMMGTFFVGVFTPIVAHSEENFVVLEFQTEGLEQIQQGQVSDAVRGVALQMLSKEEVLVWTPESIQTLLEKNQSLISEISDASEIKIGKTIGADFYERH